MTRYTKEQIQAVLTADAPVLSALESVAALQYTRETRDQIKAASAIAENHFRDFRTYMLQTCKKADLPATIQKVIDRTREYHDELKLQLEKIYGEAERAAVEANLRIERQALIREIFDQLRDRDSVDREAIISLIESGHIHRQNLRDYGIKV